MTRTLLLAALAALATGASAQTMKSVAGTYSAVSVPAYGDKPQGQLILTADGYYVQLIRRAGLKPIAAGARTKGTPEENQAVVHGSNAHFGRYTIDDGGKAITFIVETATFPNWDGKPQKRPLKVSGDTLTYTVAAPSGGGKPGEVVWRRRK